MPRIIHNHHARVCAALIAADCLVFAFVDPTRASALWLGVGYILLGLTLLTLAMVLAQSVKSYGDAAYKAAGRFLRYAAVAAIVLIGLQSIGQLTTRDIITFTPFLLIAYWYFGYNKRLKTVAVTNK